jgi:hypothetical protein
MSAEYLLDEIRDMRVEVRANSVALARVETLLGSEPIGQVIDQRISKAIAGHKTACKESRSANGGAGLRVNKKRLYAVVGLIVTAILSALGITLSNN